MGLVLYSSADGDPSPSSQIQDPPSLLKDGHNAHPFDTSSTSPYLTDLVAHNRHLPPSSTQIHDWRHGPSKARLSARQMACWSNRYDMEFYVAKYAQDSVQGDQNGGCAYYANLPCRLRPHQIRLLQQSTTTSPTRWYMYDRIGYAKGGGLRIRGQRKSVRDSCLNEMAVYQAREPCPERARPRAAPAAGTPLFTRTGRRTNRRPSLERQGAFRDATTTKRRMSVDAPSDDAELYRLGLLYDNEHACGAGFGLDTIVHDEPLYSVSVAPGRSRSRRGRVRGRSPRTSTSSAFTFAPTPGTTEWSEMPVTDMSFTDGMMTPADSSVNADIDPTLPDLGLSFANLADDAALARFLQDEEMAAYLAAVPESQMGMEIEYNAELSGSGSSSQSSTGLPTPSSSSVSSSPPVRIVYELEQEAEVETKTDTSILPSVETDSISELVSADDTNDDTSADWILDIDMVEHSDVDHNSEHFSDDDSDDWQFLRP